MPSITLALRHHAENVRNAKMLAQLALEAGPDVEMRATAKLPGDVDALRGVPLVGVRNGRGGALRGSRPGSNLR